jgi:hypothetical protein
MLWPDCQSTEKQMALYLIGEILPHSPPRELNIINLCVLIPLEWGRMLYKGKIILFLSKFF